MPLTKDKATQVIFRLEKMKVIFTFSIHHPTSLAIHTDKGGSVNLSGNNDISTFLYLMGAANNEWENVLTQWHIDQQIDEAKEREPDGSPEDYLKEHPEAAEGMSPEEWLTKAHVEGAHAARPCTDEMPF